MPKLLHRVRVKNLTTGRKMFYNSFCISVIVADCQSKIKKKILYKWKQYVNLIKC